MELDIMDYIKPELLVVAIGLYFVGVGAKKNGICENHILLIVGILGIFICSLWVVGTCSFQSVRGVALGMFTAITQGLLVAGLSTYLSQMLKLLGKNKE